MRQVVCGLVAMGFGLMPVGAPQAQESFRSLDIKLKELEVQRLRSELESREALSAGYKAMEDLYQRAVTETRALFSGVGIVAALEAAQAKGADITAAEVDTLRRGYAVFRLEYTSNIDRLLASMPALSLDGRQELRAHATSRLGRIEKQLFDPDTGIVNATANSIKTQRDAKAAEMLGKLTPAQRQQLEVCKLLSGVLTKEQLREQCGSVINALVNN